jgi:hypothetical protein
MSQAKASDHRVTASFTVNLCCWESGRDHQRFPLALANEHDEGKMLCAKVERKG